MNRNRSADALVGFASNAAGRGIAYVAVANGTGNGVTRVPFTVAPLALFDGRETGYAAIAAVGSELRRRGFARVRIRTANEGLVHDLAVPGTVPAALAMLYVKARCTLNGFITARVERADPRETVDLESRARAELQLRTAA